MNNNLKTTFSIKKRLILLLGMVALGISAASYALIYTVVAQTVSATQDRLLSAAIASIVDKLYAEGKEISLDLPYDTFSLLGAIGEDRVFYKISNDKLSITGYDDLPTVSKPGSLLRPTFEEFVYRSKVIRLAAANYPLIVDGKTQIITINVAQTKNFEETTLLKISENFVPLIVIFTLALILLALISANLITKPLNEFANKIRQRGPNDLRNISQEVPEEITPLLESFNGLITKLRNTLKQTETFISEAAHHIRTPLAVVRSESELALRKSKTPENRVHLRKIIRSVDQTNRSATQLLDHAMVLYRAERPEKVKFSPHDCMSYLVKQFEPAAGLKDVSIKLITLVDTTLMLRIDRNLFETAVRNLLDNAIKYSPAEKQIDIKCLASKNQYKIEIRNECDDVKKLKISSLFKKFTRGSNVGEIAGSGLGLSIAHEAIIASKGDLRIRQSGGNIICATLSLPLP